MNRTLYIGFKGKNNASRVLVETISANNYLLTNSFSGLKRDIEVLNNSQGHVILFGIDKTLRDAVGISNFVSDKPTRYLCNDAYWHLLRKFNGKALLIHIPSGKNLKGNIAESIKAIFG